MRKLMFVAIVATLLSGHAQAAENHTPAGEYFILHAGKLIDGLAATPRSKVSVFIRDDRIERVEPGFLDAPGATIIDLSTFTVLPGLIEGHDHFQINNMGERGIAPRMRRTDADSTVSAVLNAKAAIDQGFTTVRDVGSGAIAVTAVKRAIEAGRLEGPRILTALEAMGPTGGHSDPANGVRPDVSFEGRDQSLIDGVEDARIKVRDHHRRGADLIKIFPSGGVGSEGDDPNAQLMTDDEISTVVATAHVLGMKVAAHAHGKSAIDSAVRLGVDSIEHGTYADAESYALMKAKGVFLVPTLLVGQWIYDEAVNHPERLNPGAAAKAKAVTPQMKHNLTAAHAAGVKIAFGTDMPFEGPMSKATEFKLMAEAGMTPMETIQAATSSAADMLGLGQSIGRIRAGCIADIVAVANDPLSDLGELARIRFVMKGGKILRDRR